MPAGTFNKEFQPVANPGQLVRLLPRDEIREVEKLEQFADLGPLDFGAVDSGQQATDAAGNNQIEVGELEMRESDLGQFRFTVVSPVEVEINQPGRQSQRMKTVNIRGHMDPQTPEQFTEIYVLGSREPYFVVTNPNPFDLQQSLVQATGYRLFLSDEPIPHDQTGGRQPANVPLGDLTERAQTVNTRSPRDGGRNRGGRR